MHIGRNWNKLISKWLIEHEFNQSKNDPCLFIYNKKSIYIAVAIYVDDMISITNDNNKLMDVFTNSRLILLSQEIGIDKPGIFIFYSLTF